MRHGHASATTSVLDAFAAHTQELERLTNDWFMEASRLRGTLDGNAAAKLAGCITRIGHSFNILGGAVGILNRETNRLEHLKTLPGDASATPLFPYPAPPLGNPGADAALFLAQLH